MINRTIFAALLAGLAAPVLAGVSPSPTLDLANSMVEGKSANTAYDGSTTLPGVSAQAAAATTPGAGAALTPPSAPATTTEPPALTAETLASAKVPKKEGFIKKMFTKQSLMLGVSGAAIGGGIGLLMGGPIGALIGAVAGFAIGFILSKFMHHKH